MLLLVPWAVRSRSSMPLFINEEAASAAVVEDLCGWPAVPGGRVDACVAVEDGGDEKGAVLFCGVCRRRCMGTEKAEGR